MIRKSRARSSSLFLMELILAILFFSVASAICVQFFVKSHLLSREADELTYAVSECSGVAEILNTADSISDSIALLQQQYPNGAYPALTDLSEDAGGPAPGAEIHIYYDASFSPCLDADAVYQMIVRIEQTKQIMAGNIRMIKESRSPIYELDTRHPIARRDRL